MSEKRIARVELEQRREELKDNRYRCHRCGQIETPILVGDVGDGAVTGEPADKVLGYCCDNPDCVSDVARPHLNEATLIDSIENVSEAVERTRGGSHD